MLFNMRILCLSSVFLVLGFLPNKGDALSCYACNSVNDPGCGDPFKPYSIGIVDCSLRVTPDHLKTKESNICRKTVQKVFGETRIIRACGYIEDPERDDKACQRRTGTHEVNLHYCSCTSDLCNRATVSTAGTSIFFTALVTIFRIVS